jgi:hypothetical protein
MMKYTIVVTKDVVLPPQEFVNRWNADSACRAVACASVDYSTKSVYEPGVTGALPALDLSTIDVNPVTFYGLIIRILQKQQVYKQTEIIELEKPNGERVLVIKGAEA